jgi:two-component system, OmpR family, osmolarity sensor histidine kinase EnvZ
MVKRITILVALIGLLAFTTQIVVMHLWLRPWADSIMLIDVDRARLAKLALEQTPSRQRAALADRLSVNRLLVDHDPPAAAPAPDLSPDMSELNAFAARLQANSGADVDIRLSPPPGFVSFGFVLEGQPWWVHISAPLGLPSALLKVLLIWLTVLGATALVGLVLGVRWIARPIALLAEQIAAQRGRLRPIPLDTHASAEMQALARAFNELAMQAEAANAHRQQLLAGVSHDLRTPLARLRLRVETQCEPPVADKLTADLLALERIVDQFLAYVQGDTGMRFGQDEPLSATVRRVVDGYVRDQQPVSAKLGTISWPAPDLAVQRMLINLIDNALAYGRAPVDVVLEEREDGAVLSVCDRGTGIAAEHFARAQLPFVRLGPNRGELGHCGLGLAIVAQIAGHLGARLSMQAADGERPFSISVFIPRRG